jgi:tetratricopeptide (TPR) repeat protein
MRVSTAAAMTAAPSALLRFPVRRVGPPSPRTSAVLFAVVLALTPAVAVAQNAQRFQAALTQFAVALGGSYGDEGPQVMAALDAMNRILPDWNAEIAAIETRAQATPTDATVHAELARAYFLRGQTTAGLRELETTARLDSTHLDTSLLFGVAQWRVGHATDAAATLRAVWERDRANAVAAYWVTQSNQDTAQTADEAALTTALTAAYRRALTLDIRPSTAFATFPPPRGASEAPLVLPAAYASGYTLLRGGDATAALAQFKRAALTDPLLSDPAVDSPALMAGSTALRQGRVAVARERFRTAVSRVPTSSEAHRLLAIACLFDFDPEASIEELNAALRLRPADERARVLLARVLTQQGDLEKAETVLRTTVTMLPDSALARLWLGSTLVGLNHGDEAAAAMSDVVAHHPLAGEARLLTTIGTLRQNAGDAAAASDAFLRSITIEPNDTETHIRRARAFLEQEKREQAFAEYVAALLIDPVEPNAYMGIGQLYLNAGHEAEAIPALERVVALQPAFNEARYALGTALLRAGRAEEGNRQLAEFTRVQSQRADERRRTLAVDVLKQEAAARASEGALDRAEALWRQVIEQEPNLAAHHAALGAVLVRANHLEMAASSYERAAALGGGPDVYRQLASIYARLGRQAESVAAREKYEQALLVPAAGAGAGR